MKQNVHATLTYISSLIILISAALNVLFIICMLFMTKYAMSSVMMQHMFSHSVYQFRPGMLLGLLVTIAIGVVLLIASKRMRDKHKELSWSIAALVLGIFFAFEFNGGAVFLGQTAGLLATIGGIFGLLQSKSKQ